MKKKGPSISFIGAGNVATRFAVALSEKGCIIHQIISHHVESAQILGEIVGANFTSNNLDLLDDQSDFVIIAVPDDHIKQVLKKIPFCLIGEQILLHTSGSYDESSLASYARYFGSLYPLQTLSKANNISLQTTPFLYNANEEKAVKRVLHLSKLMSQNSHLYHHSERQKIHVAAVVVHNFTNHLWTLANQYCHQQNLDFNILWPLIQEGMKKAKKMGPFDAQTGPAIRGDVSTIHQHLDLLKDDQNFKQIYELISNSIQNIYLKS
ncbi:MAG: DUF2520 domain-containing protein [Saprospiraceae bacterium]